MSALCGRHTYIKSFRLPDHFPDPEKPKRRLLSSETSTCRQYGGVWLAASAVHSDRIAQDSHLIPLNRIDVYR